MLRHIPNLLTFLRLAAIAPFLAFLYQGRYDLACFIFFAAGLTDGLDGWLARHFQWESKLGSMLDPLADKLLIFNSFLALGLIGALPWWLVALVVARDFTISFGVLAWYYCIRTPLVFEPLPISKFNTFLQISLVLLCLLELAFMELPPSILQLWILLTAVTTSVSYVEYVWVWGKKAREAKRLS